MSKNHYGVHMPPEWTTHERAKFLAWIAAELSAEASGIAARSDETPKVAQPEARARPDAQNKGVSHD